MINCNELNDYRNQANAVRGVRNNNPGNIRKNAANQWVNKIVPGTDSEFEQFSHVEYGIRAIFVLLATYKRLYGINTITALLNRYTPANDRNDTQGYIQYMAQQINISPTEIIDLTNRETAIKVVRIILKMESVFVATDAILNKAWELLAQTQSDFVCAVPQQQPSTPTVPQPQKSGVSKWLVGAGFLGVIGYLLTR